MLRDHERPLIGNPGRFSKLVVRLERLQGDLDEQFLRSMRIATNWPLFCDNASIENVQVAAQIRILDELEAFIAVTPNFHKKGVNLTASDSI